MIAYGCAAFFGYCIGSIPTGFWISQLRGIDDITKHGSGNIGATNVSRVLGARFFFLVFFLDALKAYLYIYSLGTMYPNSVAIMLVGWCALLVGNGYSLFLGGRGGKGVSTVIGIIAAVAPYVMMVCVGVWMIMFGLVRNAGLASLCTAVALPVCAYSTGEPLYIVISCSCTTIWLWWRHYENIKRMVYAGFGPIRSDA